MMPTSLRSAAMRAAASALTGLSGLTALALVALAALAGACSPADGGTIVRVASTTSLYDTGLLDLLVPAFESAHPDYRLQVIAVGTGEALALGARGDADLVIVHAPEREAAFLAEGHGLRRTTFMRNDFVLAGPEADPAGVAGAGGAAEAMRRIAEAGESRDDVLFASRGDDSGTHIRERMLWAAARLDPSDDTSSPDPADWYLEVGQGMGATLLFAGERQAYTLTDRATLTVLRSKGLELVEVFSDPDAMQNLYSVIPVAGAAAPEGAAAFERWMLGEEAAAIIRDFGTVPYGRALFTLTNGQPSR